MRYFSKQSLLRLTTILSTLMIGMPLALTSSVASAAAASNVMIDINKVKINVDKVKIIKPNADANVMAPASKVEVEIAKPEVVKPEVVKPEAKSKFVRPFGFRPFINDEFFGFGE